MRSAMSTPADLILSGALAQPASTIVQPNCFEDPISSPTGALRCVATKPTIKNFSRGPQYFLKSELVRRLGIVVQHSQNHPVVTTGRRAITLCRPSSSSHDSHKTWPIMSESAIFEKKRLPGIDDDDDLWAFRTSPAAQRDPCYKQAVSDCPKLKQTQQQAVLSVPGRTWIHEHCLSVQNS